MHLAVGAMALAIELHVGDLVSYTWPGLADVHCLRVETTFIGVDGQPWAWLVDQADQRLILKAPANDLVKGCDAAEGPQRRSLRSDP